MVWNFIYVKQNTLLTSFTKNFLFSWNCGRFEFMPTCAEVSVQHMLGNTTYWSRCFPDKSLYEENQGHFLRLPPRGPCLPPVRLGDAGWLSLWGSDTGEASCFSLAKEQRLWWGRGNQPTVREALTEPHAGQCVDAFLPAPGWRHPFFWSWWCGISEIPNFLDIHLYPIAL